ncbi:hypothetical protein [Falsiroseomonas sp. E2-1-a20]|uniref:hypothetical protein n=1 Tax=Falsiroseomonas sp. E2-1-a20 TaxID=3239300 RepID=UPI003F2CE227
MVATPGCIARSGANGIFAGRIKDLFTRACANRGMSDDLSPGHAAAFPDAGLHARAVQAAIEAMGGTVLMARALVESGRRVDLEGLDRDATALCAAVLGLAGDQGRLLRPALEGLLRQVDGLLAEVARN